MFCSMFESNLFIIFKIVRLVAVKSTNKYMSALQIFATNVRQIGDTRVGRKQSDPTTENPLRP